MTDNEIIKALENEIHLAEYVDSDYCSNTEVSLLKSTLDLINRQKAKIAELCKAIIDGECNSITAMKAKECWHRRNSEYIERLKANNERLRSHIQEGIDLAKQIPEMLALTKAEAYKECIQKIKVKSKKEHLVCSGASLRTDYTITDKELNNLLKELVGEQ